MSRCSILLATTICACAASTDLALARGGGGGGFGGGAGRSFGGAVHSVGALSLSRPAYLPSRMANPVHNFGTTVHRTNITSTVSNLANHKVFKAGNGVTPTDNSVNPSHAIAPKPAIPPAVNLPPQVATQSVPPTPIKAGTITGKPAIPSVGYGAGPVDKPPAPGGVITPHPAGLGAIVNKPPIAPQGFPPILPLPNNPVPPNPGPVVTPKPGQTGTTGTGWMPSMHPMSGPFGSAGGVVIDGPVLAPPVTYNAPAPVYTPAPRPRSLAPQSCFRKTYQDQNIVLTDVCTNQQVLVPPGGNECLVEQDALAGSVWFADKCAMQQVLTPPAAAMEVLSLIYPGARGVEAGWARGKG